ncbi:MAG: hypothetical protein EOM40_16950 [Clostridia bacterium]|nr:hypothetical protein [Clostridia bacterium]NCC42937.1 hypothetical protein [Clostridia bacterium]
MEMMKVLGMWNTFKSNHPKFPMFMSAASQPGVITEDTVIEVKITTANGKVLETNLKIKESDLELVEQVKNLQR